MKIPIPPEPLELKAWMLSLKKAEFENRSGIDWDSSVVWAGNKLPKYLWDHWKSHLKPSGLTWQKFMRILRHRTDVGVMWYQDKLPWGEFVARVSHLIEGPIGKGSKKNAQEGRLEIPLDLAESQIPPVRDWEKFERLCSDLWKRIWDNPNVQRNGSSGQRQHGVDIYGMISQTGKTGGIQCKKKDATSTDDVLSEEDLRAIVNEAKSFVPPLSEFVIAYTGKRDAKLQLEARRIAEEHRIQGLFDVHVYSWDDILQALGDHDDVFTKHLPQFAGNNVNVKELNRRLENIEDGIHLGVSSVEKMEKVIRETAHSVVGSIALIGEHNAEIDHAKDLIDALRPKEALDYLEKLEKRIWNNLNNMLRFRLLTNKAAALSLLGNDEDAGKLFIQAYQYNSDDEKALANRAFGHLLLKQIPDAKEFANKVIQKNPLSERAYGILIHCFPTTSPIQTILQEIPTEIRKTEDVSVAIAHAARQRGDLEAAIHWLEVSLGDSVKKREKNPDLLANLASTILESFMHKPEVLNGIQLIPEDKEKIVKAITLLTNAINTLTGSESINYRTSWFLNRSTAYKLLGEPEKAISDIEMAVRANPDDPEILKQQAFMLHSKGQHESAIEIFRKIIGKPEVPEASFILASILFEKGKEDEAEKILQDSLSRHVSRELRNEEQRLLIQINLKKKNFEGARKISDLVRRVNPTDVLNLVYAARIEKLDGKPEVASKLLDEAKGYVTEKTPFHYSIELADELYMLEKYSDAWPLYERIADPRVVTPLIEHLLYSYYRSGEVEKALDTCKRIPLENKTLFLIQVELSVLEEIGELKEAALVAERYLETHPDDLQIRVRLALIWFRMDEFEKLDVFLIKDIKTSKLSVNAGFQLSHLYAERGMMEKSLKTAYELRRANLEKGEAHLKYVGVFFERENKLDDALLTAEEACVGTAVCIKNDGGETTWYILEDRADVNAAMSEIAVTSELGKKLLGKKTNQEVMLSQGAISETKVKIVEIKSKYVYVLHESLKLLPERFAETKGIERVPFKSGTEEETRESIQKLLDVVSSRHERVTQAENFYRESKLTVGAFAQLIGKNVIDVWNGLVGSKWGVKSCIGTPEERQEAFALLETHRIIAIDVTALLTAERLDLLTVLENKFDKILIAQSTIDLLLDAISERKGMGSRGYLTIRKEGDQFIRDEVTPENVQKQVEYLERIKDWVRNHCKVTPCKIALKMEKREYLENLIGAAFLETILIASEYGCPLYTDDFGTKALAQSNEFKVPGVWTQAVAISALVEKKITEEEYYKFVIRLVELNYRHTTITGAIVLAAAKLAQWSNTRPYTEILETMRGSQTEITSTILVFVEFVFLLSQQPILEFQRDTLIMAALDVLTDQRDGRVVVRLIRKAVQIKFRMIPLAEARVQQVISAWESLKIGPGRTGF